jgi:hypothetical protein
VWMWPNFRQCTMEKIGYGLVGMNPDFHWAETHFNLFQSNPYFHLTYPPYVTHGLSTLEVFMRQVCNSHKSWGVRWVKHKTTTKFDWQVVQECEANCITIRIYQWTLACNRIASTVHSIAGQWMHVSLWSFNKVPIIESQVMKYCVWFFCEICVQWSGWMENNIFLLEAPFYVAMFLVMGCDL